MTEIPADLLEALARELAPYDFGPRETTSDRHEPPSVLLTALAEWADGALIDPSTWTRVRAEHVGWGNLTEGRIAVSSVRQSKPDVPYGHYVPIARLTREDP